MFALKSLLTYVLSLLVTAIPLFASTHHLVDPLLGLIITVIAYIVSGLLLNRLVLCHLGWHFNFNSLDYVVGDKMSHFLFWPLKYPFLIIKLLINTIL